MSKTPTPQLPKGYFFTKSDFSLAVDTFNAVHTKAAWDLALELQKGVLTPGYPSLKKVNALLREVFPEEGSSKC